VPTWSVLRIVGSRYGNHSYDRPLSENSSPRDGELQREPAKVLDDEESSV
jgi:hypothetical protein